MSSAPTPGKNDVRREGGANSLGAQARMGGAPREFAMPPSMRPFGKPGKLPVCPTLFRGVTDDVLPTSSDRLADRLE